MDNNFCHIYIYIFRMYQMRMTKIYNKIIVYFYFLSSHLAFCSLSKRKKNSFLPLCVEYNLSFRVEKLNIEKLHNLRRKVRW
jgi:hypothetical protein